MTAVNREAAWLATTGDGLPALLATAGGPFDVVQPYWPRTPAARKAALYVTRSGLTDLRFGAHRRIRRHALLVRVVWPIGATSVGTQIWEAEQAAFDTAVDLVLARIVGFDNDKTHGGRFLAVAEAPAEQPINARFSDPARMPAQGRAELTVDITYSADDADYTA